MGHHNDKPGSWGYKLHEWCQRTNISDSGGLYVCPGKGLSLLGTKCGGRGQSELAVEHLAVYFEQRSGLGLVSAAALKAMSSILAVMVSSETSPAER